MHIKRLAVAGGMALALSAAAEARDFERLLRGEYAFTGEATCLLNAAGFNPDLTPVATGTFPVIVSFSINGVRIFNGDGTGTLRAKIVGLTHPFVTPALFVNRGGGQANDLTGTFTYDVTSSLKITLNTVTLGGTATGGTRSGQTFTVTSVPPLEGRISEDLDGITLAHDEAGIETLTWSNGDAQQRICHRSRILLDRKDRR